MARSHEILIIGAGVHGLSCAALLLDAGRAVRVVAERGPLESTSGVAAALWYPYHVGPRDRVLEWARVTLAHLLRLAEDPATGVRLVDGIEVVRNERRTPAWADLVPDWRPARAEELPEGCRSGFHFRLPVVEMPIYLPWLLDRCEGAGLVLELGRRLESLEEAWERSSVVVDCAGLGARELVPDPRVHPIRGQIQRVASGGSGRFLLDDEGPGGFTYVVPRSGDVILGGTAEVGDDDLEPRASSRSELRERCLALEPELRASAVHGDVVGLRPGRDEVRLELEHGPGDRRVIHDYGHGGAGVTLSWGCAEEVRGLCLGEG